MTKRILCAIDVSQADHDLAVLTEAVSLARSNAAHLDVLSVLPDYGTSFVGSFFKDNHHAHIKQSARKQLNEMVKGAIGNDADLLIRKVIATGSTYEEILKTAETTGCGLIVIGAHKPNYQDYLLGPNAARVVRHAPCSVYVVR